MKKLMFMLISILVFNSCENITKKEVFRANSYDNYSKESSTSLEYARKNDLSTDFYFIVDLSKPSGRDRFYVWDFKKNKIVRSFLVMNGRKSEPDKNNVRRYSNTPRSNQSSLGKYKISKNKVPSINYKYKYLLYGLEDSNDMALMRGIVLHPSKHVPNREVYPRKIGKSLGCPSVSQGAFKIIDKKLQSTDKNVLLLIV